MKEILELPRQYGCTGVLLALLIGLILKGEIIFRYPRSKK
jgi:hypothetical protein